MYRPTVIVPPTQYPVTLAEAKSRLHAGDLEDDDITGLIAAATATIENRLGCAFFSQTLEFAWDRWPSYDLGPLWYDRLVLPRATPLRSVTSVVYTDQDGVPTTWNTSQYQVDTDSSPGQIVLNRGSAWPTAILQGANGIRVRYIAGYEAQSPEIPFPENIKLAIKYLVYTWYDNRDTLAVGTAQTAVVLPNTVELLLAGEGSEAS